MKHKSRLFILILVMLSMLMVMGGCSRNGEASPKDVINNDGAELEDEVVDDDINDSQELEDEIEDLTDDNLEEGKEEIKEDFIVNELPLIEGGIRGVYDQHNLQAGTCINEHVIDNFADHIIQNYNTVTMENDMKPNAILNHAKSVVAGELVVEFPQKTIKQLEWAKTNNMKVRGHVLVWYSQTPQWIFYEDFDTKKELVDRDTMLSRMDSFIKQTFELLESLDYLDMFYAYDIVNEAINDDGTLRDCLWKEIIGDDYIWHAFYYGDKYAPESIKLYYNDYNEQFKTKHVVKLVESLVDEEGRSLIDGIGCQAHLYTGDSIDEYIKTLEAFSATGLDVHITEIDVSLGTWQNILEPTEENLQKQGLYYYELVNRVLEGNKAGTTSIGGITFWGIADQVSWRRDRNPLLFDLEYKPKYAYFGAIQDYDHASK